MHSSKDSAVLLKDSYLLAEGNIKNKFDHIFIDDGNDASFVRLVKKAISANCKVTVGAFTSKECLLAGPYLEKSGMYLISPSCGHDKIQTFYPKIHTIVPKIEMYADSIAKESKKHEKPIIIQQKSDVYSSHFTSLLRKRIKDARIVNITKDGEIIDGEKHLSQSRLIIFTTYPLPSFAFMLNLNKMKLDKRNISVFASASWAYDLKVIKKQSSSLKKFKSVLITDFWDPTSRGHKFFADYKKSFNRRAENLAALSYDLSTAILACKESLRAKPSEVDIRRCIDNNKSRPVAGDFKLEKNSSFARRELRTYSLLERLN